ncbi:hypothetical protein J21TS3_41550 [Paenibacillus cookii]|uniref:Uncharacterized protein n=1 Tax=Paenibacillus cookii TaxID=157839 RepID=A0ABQ4M1E9_9BACL|nr:hypothetical protein J21TS3_41550 [Paenibacillus cookii]
MACSEVMEKLNSLTTVERRPDFNLVVRLSDMVNIRYNTIKFTGNRFICQWNNYE